ncbi:hypothetical protein [Variovorax sp. YR752]|uniref:hypothetical protein n=1 Tax=Variovorax sp. YR752 TaxID=1884383 RepID=UPI003137ED3E
MAVAADRASAADAELRRLSALAPLLADELLAAWSDPPRLGRLIEAWLGGEWQVDLETDALVALVRLYEHLEGLRLVGEPDPKTGSAMPGGRAGYSNPSAQS